MLLLSVLLLSPTLLISVTNDANLHVHITHEDKKLILSKILDCILECIECQSYTCHCAIPIFSFVPFARLLSRSFTLTENLRVQAIDEYDNRLNKSLSTT